MLRQSVQWTGRHAMPWYAMHGETRSAKMCSERGEMQCQSMQRIRGHAMPKCTVHKGSHAIPRCATHKGTYDVKVCNAQGVTCNAKIREVSHAPAWSRGGNPHALCFFGMNRRGAGEQQPREEFRPFWPCLPQDLDAECRARAPGALCPAPGLGAVPLHCLSFQLRLELPELDVLVKPVRRRKS